MRGRPSDRGRNVLCQCNPTGCPFQGRTPSLHTRPVNAPGKAPVTFLPESKGAPVNAPGVCFLNSESAPVICFLKSESVPVICFLNSESVPVNVPVISGVNSKRVPVSVPVISAVNSERVPVISRVNSKCVTVKFGGVPVKFGGVPVKFGGVPVKFAFLLPCEKNAFGRRGAHVLPCAQKMKI